MKRKNQNDSEYQRCVKYQATATSYSDSSVTLRSQYAHFPDHTYREILEIRQNFKRKTIEKSASIDRLVEETFHEDKRRCESNSSILNIPSIQIIKNTVQKKHRKTHSALPKIIEHPSFLLPDAYYQVIQGECFLLYDGPFGGDRSLTFSTDNDMIYLSKQEY